ncbi:MAG: hypothetical protein NTU60_11700 [Candidatus Aminicenantes bacterium]|nr:hypothetical protein [Candidatus Aminicenantes bacterium]
MSALKIIAAAVLAISLAQPAPGQSLTEAAKKEKERRESLKGKAGVVVTNADLAGIKKKPAVAANPQTPAESEKPGGGAEPREPSVGEAAAPADLQIEARKKFDEKKSELEVRLSKAKELVELLNLKMNALQQQFYSFNSMTAKDQVQKQLSETLQRLQAAQAEEAKVKDELDKILAQGVKDKFPPAAIN